MWNPHLWLVNPYILLQHQPTSTTPSSPTLRFHTDRSLRLPTFEDSETAIVVAWNSRVSSPVEFPSFSHHFRAVIDIHPKFLDGWWMFIRSKNQTWCSGKSVIVRDSLRRPWSSSLLARRLRRNADRPRARGTAHRDPRHGWELDGMMGWEWGYSAEKISPPWFGLKHVQQWGETLGISWRYEGT